MKPWLAIFFSFSVLARAALVEFGTHWEAFHGMISHFAGQVADNGLFSMMAKQPRSRYSILYCSRQIIVPLSKTDVERKPEAR